MARRRFVVGFFAVAFVVADLTMLSPAYFKRARPYAELAVVAAQDPASQELLVVYPTDLREPSVLYYSDRPVRVVTSPQELADLVNERGSVMAILPITDLESLTPAFRTTVVAQNMDFAYARIGRGSP